MDMQIRVAGKAKNKLRSFIFNAVAEGISSSFDIDLVHQQCQLGTVSTWKSWRQQGASPYRSIREAGFRCYSQFEEDGIILYIMTMLGIIDGTVVEMCCGPGNECMAANLIINHGFKGYLFDGSDSNVLAATSFFSSKKDCLLYIPQIQKQWITTDNVNTLLASCGVPADIDFFSLDIDGNDYWIWRAIENVRPKVCCLETHNLISSELSLTIPYDPNFDCWSSEQPDFRSASLLAMVKLGRSKGYRLIGAHRHGFNVFFMRDDIGKDFFPEVSVEDVHNNEWTRYSQTHRWQAVEGLPWVEV